MKRLIFLSIAFVFITGCASTVPSDDDELAADEAGLLMIANKAEDEIQTAGSLFRDEELRLYIKAIACKLDKETCEVIRPYILRQPFMNASMAPNGMMHVWTGLLLRTQNEAQLAAVIAHEMVHYRERHVIKSFRNIRRTMSAHAALAVLTSGYSAIITAPIALGSMSGFSKDQEREADLEGARMMVNAGYDPREAATIWQNYIEETKATGDDSRSYFLASHPSPEDRVDKLYELAEQLITSSHQGAVFFDRFEQRIEKHRKALLEDQLALREFDGTSVLLSHLEENEKTSGLALFYRGELHRLRGDESDTEEAISFYQRSIETGSYPPESHRASGLLLLRMEKPIEAKEHFERYLELSPSAPDAEMIQAYLEKLE